MLKNRLSCHFSVFSTVLLLGCSSSDETGNSISELDPTLDNDRDGFTGLEGDCNDQNSLVHPDAYEIATNSDGNREGIDNNCNGEIDELPLPCEELLPTTARQYGNAIGLCRELESAEFRSDMTIVSYNLISAFGNHYLPLEGERMLALSTGKAIDKRGFGFKSPQDGTDNDTVAPHPYPAQHQGSCVKADPAQANDVAELVLRVKAPANANSFSFQFNFMSAEYPEFLCKKYDDTFVALLKSEKFTGNISFDPHGNPVSVNAAFFTICAEGTEPDSLLPEGTCQGARELGGTGYENNVGGGTGWLTTRSPITPGEVFDLHFLVFDEGDHIYDSSVLIDNFRWHRDGSLAPETFD